MKYPPTPLTVAEAHGLLKAARTPTHRALVILLWRGGLRCAEACALTWADVEEHERGGLRLHVRHGKGGKARFVGIGKKPSDFIRALPESTHYLLETRNGTPLQGNNVRRLMKVLGKVAGIKKRVHPHCLRHTFAREMHDELKTVRQIQVAMGHSDLGTTQTYLMSIGCDEAVDIMAERDW